MLPQCIQSPEPTRKPTAATFSLPSRHKRRAGAHNVKYYRRNRLDRAVPYTSAQTRQALRDQELSGFESLVERLAATTDVHRVAGVPWAVFTKLTNLPRTELRPSDLSTAQRTPALYEALFFGRCIVDDKFARLNAEQERASILRNIIMRYAANSDSGAYGGCAWDDLLALLSGGRGLLICPRGAQRLVEELRLIEGELYASFSHLSARGIRDPRDSARPGLAATRTLAAYFRRFGFCFERNARRYGKKSTYTLRAGDLLRKISTNGPRSRAQVSDTRSFDIRTSTLLRKTLRKRLDRDFSYDWAAGAQLVICDAPDQTFAEAKEDHLLELRKNIHEAELNENFKLADDLRAEISRFKKSGIGRWKKNYLVDLSNGYAWSKSKRATAALQAIPKKFRKFFRVLLPGGEAVALSDHDLCKAHPHIAAVMFQDQQLLADLRAMNAGQDLPFSKEHYVSYLNGGSKGLPLEKMDARYPKVAAMVRAGRFTAGMTPAESRAAALVRSELSLGYQAVESDILRRAMELTLNNEKCKAVPMLPMHDGALFALSCEDDASYVDAAFRRAAKDILGLEIPARYEIAYHWPKA